MRLFLAVLVLIFSLQSLTKADDIRDFEIEGMSIGDSLENHINNEKFKSYVTADYFKDNDFTLYQTTLSNFEEFKDVDISFLTKDNKKIITSISGIIYLNYENCIKKKKEITDDIKIFLKGIKYYYEERTENHGIDKTGKSKVYTNYFYFDSEDIIAVQCLDFSKELKYSDGLKLYIALDEYVDWIAYRAYK